MWCGDRNVVKNILEEDEKGDFVRNLHYSVTGGHVKQSESEPQSPNGAGHLYCIQITGSN